MASQLPKKTAFSLYADLLEPEKQKSASSTISSAPVRYDVQKNGGGDEEALQKKKDASLKFQPIKRPQVQQKTKGRPGASSSTSSSGHKFSSSTTSAAATASSPEKQLPNSAPQQQPDVQQSNFEDWVGDDEEYFYQENRPKAERGGRKKKKKNQPQERAWDWDDIYDPTFPNNYADYRGSEEQAREVRDWKARLYYHQLKEAKKSKNGAMESDEEEERRPRPTNSMFAPPPNLNFAPPSFTNVPSSRMDDDDNDGEDYYPPDSLAGNDRDRMSFEPQPAFARAPIADDSTGEDAYMRRMRMGGIAPTEEEPQAPLPPAAPSALTPPPVATNLSVDLDAKRAEAQAKIAAFKARIASQAPKPPTPNMTPGINPAPPQSTLTPVQQPSPPPPPPEEDLGLTISRAPVRYNVPSSATGLSGNKDEDMPMASFNGQAAAPSSSEQPKTNRPGQKGFAERLLSRYGWEKGQGLGARGDGITTAIVAKAEKRKKRPASEGGGWVAPANMGKIVGGKKRKIQESSEDAEAAGESVDGQYGAMSEVINLRGMLTGLDVQREIEERNLMQEIGEEMQSQYGNVERVFIWDEERGGGNEVFVKFTSQLSALRAVTGMDGSTFADNEVVARFFDAARFERGEYA